MIQVSISDLKTNLSSYLHRVEEDETVQICRHNRPIAEIRSLGHDSQRPAKRELGIGTKLLGKREIPDSTFAPLSDEFLGDLGPLGTYEDEQN